MSDSGYMWIITLVVGIAALLIAIAVGRLVYVVQQFLARASKTLDQVDRLLGEKGEEIGTLVKSVTLVSERVEAIVADVTPVVRVFKKLAVTADDIGVKGAKALFSFNNIVSRLVVGMLHGSKKD